MPGGVAVLRGGDSLPLVQSAGRAESIVGVRNHSRFRSLDRIQLDAGGATRPIQHPSETVYCVAEGTGMLASGHGAAHELRRHAIVYVPGGTRHHLRAITPMLVYGGPCPPHGDGTRGAPVEADGTSRVPQVFDGDRDGVPLPIISRQARLVVWSGVGARIATMNFVVLESGEANQPHTHAASDDTIAILEGRGTARDLAARTALPFEAGAVVHVPAGVPHQVCADRGSRIVSAGGPCPPDLDLLRACGLISEPQPRPGG